MTTISECIQSHNKEQAERKAELEAVEIHNHLKSEEETLAAWRAIGLEPNRVDGRTAFFEYEGEEVEFVFRKWAKVISLQTHAPNMKRGRSLTFLQRIVCLRSHP